MLLPTTAWSGMVVPYFKSKATNISFKFVVLTLYDFLALMTRFKDKGIGYCWKDIDVSGLEGKQGYETENEFLFVLDTYTTVELSN